MPSAVKLMDNLTIKYSPLGRKSFPIHRFAAETCVLLGIFFGEI